ncbi:unnamed protein product [Meganyctiphanes norvegica]|uniref:Uncharacterized protein n=1 Tax=Meganyctiphanes norvegica TaxID=48144 RepID=A0AAV2R6N1_MEGNR
MVRILLLVSGLMFGSLHAALAQITSGSQMVDESRVTALCGLLDNREVPPVTAIAYSFIRTIVPGRTIPNNHMATPVVHVPTSSTHCANWPVSNSVTILEAVDGPS